MFYVRRKIAPRPPEFRACSEVPEVNRKQAAAQNSCIKRNEQVFYVSSRLSPLLPDDRLLPIRPHRHNLNRHPKLPLQERNVKVQLLRKLILRPDLRSEERR